MSDRWLTVPALAGLGLPGLPGTERGLRALAARDWRGDPLRWRLAGGEAEYHASLLPEAARAALAATEGPSKARWAAFERLPEGMRAEAGRRQRALLRLAELRVAIGAAAAVARVAAEEGVAGATVEGWRARVRNVPRDEWLPALAPARGGRPAEAACDPRAWDFLLSDYLRPARAAFSACCARLREAAAAQGWAPVPAERTLRRRLEREVPREVVVAARAGLREAARLIPAQRRDRSHLAPLEAVNADGHRFDVFVTVPGRATPVRPVMVAIQDLASGRILAHRTGLEESWPLVRLAFLDLLRDHGIPAVAHLDNGRAFASKWLTGGQVNRFRFKVKAGEPEGLLTSVGIRVRWTTPYHGQAKPIERAFGDLCEAIARHPACAGAGTGRAPHLKPEDYGSRAIPLASFRALVAAEIARHNARPGRRGGACAGRSFDATWAEGVARTVIVRAGAEQLRRFALAAERVTARAPSGEIHLAGARWWAEPLIGLAGRQVTVRFDPENLAAPVAVEDADGRFVCEAAALEDVPFDSLDAARATARRNADWRRRLRAGIEAERRLAAEDLARLLPGPAPAPEPPAPAAVRMVAAGGARGGAGPAPGGASGCVAGGDPGAALSRAIGLLEQGVIRFPGRARDA